LKPRPLCFATGGAGHPCRAHQCVHQHRDGLGMAARAIPPEKAWSSGNFTPLASTGAGVLLTEGCRGEGACATVI
jgi:succinate dehydrogenase/fumarate reductase flavoprotein subunit